MIVDISFTCILVYFIYSSLDFLDATFATLLSYPYIFAFGPAGVPGSFRLDLFCIYPWKRSLSDTVYLILRVTLGMQTLQFNKIQNILAFMDRVILCKPRPVKSFLWP